MYLLNKPNKIPHLIFEKLKFTIAIALIFLYAMFTRPLVFQQILPYALRYFIELIPLFLLFYINKRNFLTNSLLIIFILIFFIINFIVNSASFQISFLTTLKFIYFIILFSIFSENYKLREYTCNLFVNFWLLVCVLTISACIIFWFDNSFFKRLDLQIGDNGYEYSNNFILGNIRLIAAENFILSKPSWYFYEYGVLSFFFAINYIGSDSLISNKKSNKRFKSLNLIAGLCTLSITFYIFLFVYFAINFFRRRGYRTIFFLIYSIIFIFFLSHFELIHYFFKNSTSIDDRLLRFDIFMDVIKNNPIKTLLIGSGPELQGLHYDRGISSGFLNSIAERGFIFSLLSFSYLAYLLRHKFEVFLTFLYFNLSFDFLLFPISSVMLTLFILGDKININSVE